MRLLQASPCECFRELDFPLQPDIRRGCSNADAEFSTFGSPAHFSVVVEAQRLSVECDGDLFRFSRFQINLCKAFELFDSARNRRLSIGDIQLSDLAALHLASIRDIERYFEFSVDGDFRTFQTGVFKACV